MRGSDPRPSHVDRGYLDGRRSRARRLVGPKKGPNVHAPPPLRSAPCAFVPRLISCMRTWTGGAVRACAPPPERAGVGRRRNTPFNGAYAVDKEERARRGDERSCMTMTMRVMGEDTAGGRGRRGTRWVGGWMQARAARRRVLPQLLLLGRMGGFLGKRRRTIMHGTPSAPSAAFLDNTPTYRPPSGALGSPPARTSTFGSARTNYT